MCNQSCKHSLNRACSDPQEETGCAPGPAKAACCSTLMETWRSTQPRFVAAKVSQSPLATPKAKTVHKRAQMHPQHTQIYTAHYLASRDACGMSRTRAARAYTRSR